MIGIDNGITGSLSSFKDGKLIDFRETFSRRWIKPTVTSKVSQMSRIDIIKLMEWLNENKKLDESVTAVIERPMTDQVRFNASISSHHAQEAVMIALELVGIPYMTIDSKVWQSKFLPRISGSISLKYESKRKGKAEFPEFSELIEKHGDADAIFIGKLAIDYPELFVPDSQRKLVKKKQKNIKNFGVNFDGN
jgi:hypothetical protein